MYQYFRKYFSRTCARRILGKKNQKSFFVLCRCRPKEILRQPSHRPKGQPSHRPKVRGSRAVHRPGRTKARLARIPMYEPDDDDLAAEEQARSLRVSPDLFHLQTNLFPPRTLSPLTARSPSSTSSNRRGRNTIRMKTHGRTLRKTRAGDCALRLGTEAIGRSDGGRSPKWPPTRTSAKE